MATISRQIIGSRDDEGTRRGSDERGLCSSKGQTKAFRFKLVFLGIALSGLLMHFFALYLTRIITVAGIGQEGNPLFYLMGGSYFVVFGFAVLIGYYSIDWLLRIPVKYKILGASWLTALTAFDFMHDLMFLVNFSSMPLLHLLTHVP